MTNTEMINEFKDLSQPKGVVNTLFLENSLISDAPEEGEANALIPAKRQGITVFNLEEHYDENLVRRNPCSTRIKKEKPDKSG
ncbi:unnamed protein product [Brassica oleracea]|uniref:(rape) hypothetical protein n=1 Tax=Brassica napus TaxID=3708 RepID=A0A816TVV8_BRANA|nr:unnamed protein product [Brassica napus]